MKENPEPLLKFVPDWTTDVIKERWIDLIERMGYVIKGRVKSMGGEYWLLYPAPKP